MAEVTAILKEDIDPMIRDLYFNASNSPLSRMWKEGRNGGEGTSDFLNGDKAYIVARYGRHSGVRSQGEAPTLRGVDDRYEYVALPFLRGLFDDAVLQPIHLLLKVNTQFPQPLSVHRDPRLFHLGQDRNQRHLQFMEQT